MHDVIDRTASRVLIDGLIGTYDLTDDGALRAHIAQVLRRVGVERDVVAVGAVFDPTVHHAVATEPTGIRVRNHRVIKTIRPGWSCGRIVIRAPEVAVWTVAAAA